MVGPTFRRDGTATLRPIEEDDLDFVRLLRNHPAVRYRYREPIPRNGTQVESEYEDDISDEDGLALLVCVEDEGDDGSDGPAPTPVGMVEALWTDEAAGRTHVRELVAPDRRGEGHATTGLRSLAACLFEERRCHKLAARALASDERRRTALESVGFEPEAHLREERFVDGRHADEIRYGLVADDWGRR